MNPPKCTTIVNIFTDKISVNNHRFTVCTGTNTASCKDCGLILIAPKSYFDDMRKGV